MRTEAIAIVATRIEAVCSLAAPRTMMTDLRQKVERAGLVGAVARHDTAALCVTATGSTIVSRAATWVVR